MKLQWTKIMPVA